MFNCPWQCTMLNISSCFQTNISKHLLISGMFATNDVICVFTKLYYQMEQLWISNAEWTVSNLCSLCQRETLLSNMLNNFNFVRIIFITFTLIRRIWLNIVITILYTGYQSIGFQFILQWISHIYSMVTVNFYVTNI